MPALSSTWDDVQCPACRLRLAEADHPSDRYAVTGFRSVVTGHATFWTPGNGTVLLCKASPWKPKSQE